MSAIVFPKRGRHVVGSSDLFKRRRVWRSKCGRYHVVEIVAAYRRDDHGRNVVEWFVYGGSLDADWLSTHRSRKAAFRSAARRFRADQADGDARRNERPRTVRRSPRMKVEAVR